jgi:hypothetical protein
MKYISLGLLALLATTSTPQPAGHKTPVDELGPLGARG